MLLELSSLSLYRSNKKQCITHLFCFRTSVIEKELPSFDERPALIAVNGLDSPSSSERSRSPSPTLDMPSYSTNEVNYTNRNSSYNYTNSGALDTVTTNSLNDFYPSVSVSDDKQTISQILKEANSVSVVNNQPEVKPKVSGLSQKYCYINFSLQITAEDLQEIENQNNEIRKHLHKLVRRPGKNFTELFDNIKTLKGNIDIQVKMVELIIKESLRFKRQHLAHLLEEYIQNLLSCENK